MISYQIYSEYDGWHIQKINDNKIEETWVWNHNYEGDGTGGAKTFGKILEDLGYHVYYEEVC